MILECAFFQETLEPRLGRVEDTEGDFWQSKRCVRSHGLLAEGHGIIRRLRRLASAYPQAVPKLNVHTFPGSTPLTRFIPRHGAMFSGMALASASKK